MSDILLNFIIIIAAVVIISGMIFLFWHNRQKKQLGDIRKLL